MFENLQERFDRAFKVLKGHGQITEVNIGETLKEVRKALLDADVDYKTAKEFVKRVKEKALGQHVLTALKPGQVLIKITQEELTEQLEKYIEDSEQMDRIETKSETESDEEEWITINISD